MSLRPIRGFRFDGASLGGAPVVGPEAGLILTPAGRLALVEDADAVRQAIVVLLTTLPGERVMRPDYGCPLHRLMFAPNDPTTAGLAIHYVRQALRRFEPRIEIVRLDAGAQEADAGRLLVELQYRLKRTDQMQHLSMAVDLQGAA